MLNADGSRTVTVTDYNGNGTVQIGQTVTTTTADGLSTSQNGYLDAHTARDWIENSATVINADGSRTDTTGEFLGSNVSVDEWRTTTVSADQTHLTFYDYLDGNISTAAETRTLATNSDGSTTDTYRYGDPSLGGMLLTTINTSASGLSKTTTRNYTPAGLPANLNLTTLSGKAVYAGTASFTRDHERRHRAGGGRQPHRDHRRLQDRRLDERQRRHRHRRGRADRHHHTYGQQRQRQPRRHDRQRPRARRRWQMDHDGVGQHVRRNAA